MRTITSQHSVSVATRLPRGLKIQVASFSLKIFVGVMMSWKSSEAWGFPKRRGRALILARSCHVGCTSLHIPRTERSSFARGLLKSPAWWHLVPLSVWQSLCWKASTVALMRLLRVWSLLIHGHSSPATTFTYSLPTILRLTMYYSLPYWILWWCATLGHK